MTVTSSVRQDVEDPDREPPISPDPAPTAWQRSPGVELLGAARGSGLREETALVRRADGQVVQVSALLSLILEQVAPAGQPARATPEIADAVSAAYGRRLGPEGLDYLLTERLAPLGLVQTADATGPAPAPTSDPVLALSLRGTLLPAAVVRVLASVLRPLYFPPVVLAGLLAFVAADLYLLRTGDLLAAVDQLLATPALVLGLLVAMTAAAVVHEIGHAAACRYGGATPGRIGFGIYIVFLAFFTDVTDSYRLDRAGRVRTDLGGLYFNALTVVGLAIAYATTDSGFLLLVLVLLHLGMVQQLIPAIRLDGYFLLADLAGVPDLFARIGPVFRSLRRGREPDPRVAELRPYARVIVVLWVLLVVPMLVVAFGWLLWSLPVVVPRTWAAILVQADRLSVAVDQVDVLGGTLALISIVSLALPLVGIAIILWRMLRLLAVAVVRPRPPDRLPPAAAGAAPPPAEDSPLTAAAFRDTDLVRRAAQRRWDPEEEPSGVLTPFSGTRRVIVMSRKGGVGKTTLTLALGSLFATRRLDRVIAVDANPDAGNLAHRVASTIPGTVTDVLARRDTIDSYADLRAFITQAPELRLEVLAADDDPKISMALGDADYVRLNALLRRFYNLILFDTGTGILDGAHQGLLSDADHLVVVLRPGVDGARAAALTLDWLDGHGHRELVSRAVVVVNAVKPRVGAALDPIVTHFEQRCAAVVTVPWDPALEKGSITSLAELRRKTQDALSLVAAAVADGFAAPGGDL